MDILKDTFETIDSSSTLMEEGGNQDSGTNDGGAEKEGFYVRKPSGGLCIHLDIQEAVKSSPSDCHLKELILKYADGNCTLSGKEPLTFSTWRLPGSAALIERLLQAFVSSIFPRLLGSTYIDEVCLIESKSAVWEMSREYSTNKGEEVFKSCFSNKLPSEKVAKFFSAFISNTPESEVFNYNDLEGNLEDEFQFDVLVGVGIFTIFASAFDLPSFTVVKKRNPSPNYVGNAYHRIIETSSNFELSTAHPVGLYYDESNTKVQFMAVSGIQEKKKQEEQWTYKNQRYYIDTVDKTSTLQKTLKDVEERVVMLSEEEYTNANEIDQGRLSSALTLRAIELGLSVANPLSSPFSSPTNSLDNTRPSTVSAQPSTVSARPKKGVKKKGVNALPKGVRLIELVLKFRKEKGLLQLQDNEEVPVTVIPEWTNLTPSALLDRCRVNDLVASTMKPYNIAILKGSTKYLKSPVPAPFLIL